MKTRVTDMLGVEFPILAFSHCRDVVAAVTRAGGFGVLGAVAHTPDQLDVDLTWIEEQTSIALAGSIKLLIMAHVLITMPWVIRLCLASLTNHDRAAEEAAASLGAGPPLVIWRVTLPAMRSGIIAAALFAFVISFENTLSSPLA